MRRDIQEYKRQDPIAPTQRLNRVTLACLMRDMRADILELHAAQVAAVESLKESQAIVRRLQTNFSKGTRAWFEAERVVANIEQVLTPPKLEG